MAAPLLSGSRRWLAAVLLAALMVPSLGMLFSRAQTRSTAENRMLAPAPAWPRDVAGWLALPRRVDAYLDDHFAFRMAMTSAASAVRWRLGASLDHAEVLRGKHDRLFLRDNLLEETGGVVRADVANNYADFVCGVSRRLKARGLPFVFALAPSPAVLYPEDLPDWAPRGRVSDYDLVIARTRRCGVNTVDLRPPLLAAKPSGSIYYHHDTHWTPKGALIAYDQLVQALSRPDWAIAPAQLTWRRTQEDDADLARMSGASGLRPELMDRPDLSAQTANLDTQLLSGVVETSSRPGFIDVTGHGGPTVLFIGDSYSADFMPPYFAAHVARFAWMHQQSCGFDWNVFDVVKPDYVILMPVDRSASCKPGVRPRHMPAG